MADEWTKGVGKRSIFDVSDWMGSDELGGGPMYSAVEHFGSEYGTGEGKSGVSHPLHVPPTDFAYTLIESAGCTGRTYVGGGECVEYVQEKPVPVPKPT